MSAIVDTILRLYAIQGQEPYGEVVTIDAHCRQCAALAEREGASKELVAAAFLHDVGHFTETPDDAFGVHRHDHGGAEFLKEHFPDSVVEPVRLHVEAKRYMVAKDPSYFDKLSPASVHTLNHQGGAMSEEEIAAFEAKPYFQDGVKVRQWDDAGKVEGLVVPDLGHYIRLLEELVLDPM